MASNFKEAKLKELNLKQLLEEDLNVAKNLYQEDFNKQLELIISHSHAVSQYRQKKTGMNLSEEGKNYDSNIHFQHRVLNF